MGRRDKSYHKDLKQQTKDRLEMMLQAGVGQSKKDAIAKGTDRDKIFSYNTYQTYYKHCKYFAEYVAQNHPEATTLRAAKKYVPEWLQSRVDQVDQNGKHLSAWTINTERQAINKLYGISPDDKDFFVAPIRHRQDIVRSRVPVERDRHFSVTNNDEFIRFCKATGCRRSAVEKLRGDDLYSAARLEGDVLLGKLTGKMADLALEARQLFPHVEYFVLHRGDKGGRSRFAPVVGPDERQVVGRMIGTRPEEKVWQHVPKNADIHSYRGDYATTIYKMCARKIEEIPFDKVNRGTGQRYQSEVYVCRKDESGKKLDKAAMLLASKALGHNRLEVVANNYIRGL